MEKQVAFFGACYYSGVIALLRWWIQRSGPRLIILNYHRAAGGDLRRHLLYLRRHYRMLHLEEALEELYTPNKQRTRLRDRRTPLVLTFDDGYHDNYTHGLALVRELQVPITIFVIPGYIENRHCFWWLAGDLLVRHAQVATLDFEGHVYHLAQQKDQVALAHIIYMHVYNATSVAAREAFLTMIQEALCVDPTVLCETETSLRWSEIREMEASGWISFGAHTMHHPVLAHLQDPVEVQREVSECRTVLEQQLGHPIRTLAYPLGRSAHIGDEGLRAARVAGYTWAITTIYGINTPQRDPLQIQRVMGDVKRHWLLMAADICGLRKVLLPLFSYGYALLSTEGSPARLLSSLYSKIKAFHIFTHPASHRAIPVRQSLESTGGKPS